MKLYEITEQFQKLETLLMTGEISDESEALLDELMQAEEWKLDGYLMVWANLKAFAEGAKAESQRLAKKAKTAENAIDSMKSRLALHFATTGTKDVTRPLGKIVLKKAARALVIDVDDADIPERYLTKKMVVSVNNAAIKADLKSNVWKQEAGEIAHLAEAKQFIQIF